MGLINFVKNGVRELFIARPPHLKHLIVYKWPGVGDPQSGDAIPQGARVTTDMDDSAVFLKPGTPPVVVALPPGTVQPVTGQNLPFLSSFINDFTGGNAYRAQLFFVRVTPMRDETNGVSLKFGGTLLPTIDPEFGFPLNPRAHGSYSIQVVDPVKFILEHAGQGLQGDNDAILGAVRNNLMQTLSATLSNLLAARRGTFLNLAPLALELTRALAQQFHEVVPGVRLLEVGKLSISLNEQEQRELATWQKDLAMVSLETRKEQARIALEQAKAAQKQIGIDQDLQTRERGNQIDINRQAGMNQVEIQKQAGYKDLAGGNFHSAAVAEAVIGAGQGLAKGGGGGGIAGSAMQMAVGLGMAGMMQNQMFQPPGAPPAPAQPPSPPATGSTVTCPQCAQQVPRGKFCRECGSPLSTPKKFCVACGVELGTAKFCMNCGTAAPT